MRKIGLACERVHV